MIIECILHVSLTLLDYRVEAVRLFCINVFMLWLPRFVDKWAVNLPYSEFVLVTKTDGRSYLMQYFCSVDVD